MPTLNMWWGLYNEPTAAGQFAAGRPQEGLANATLDTKPSNSNLSGGAASPASAPPTRLDSMASIPQTVEASPVYQDGWGQPIPSPCATPSPKALFQSPTVDAKQLGESSEVKSKDACSASSVPPEDPNSKGETQETVEKKEPEKTEEKEPEKTELNNIKTPKVAEQPGMTSRTASDPDKAELETVPKPDPTAAAKQKIQKPFATAKKSQGSQPSAPTTEKPYQGGFYWKNLDW